jgi:hypothetical protein
MEKRLDIAVRQAVFIPIEAPIEPPVLTIAETV